MEIIRKYKKLSTWDFLELIDREIERAERLSFEEYISYFDELKMRTYESISEGELYKLRLRCKRLLERAQRVFEESEFQTLSELAREI